MKPPAPRKSRDRRAQAINVDYLHFLDGSRCVCGHIAAMHGYPPAGGWSTWRCYRGGCLCAKYSPKAAA